MLKDSQASAVQDVAQAGAYGAPPIAVAGGTLLGIPLGDVVLWGTLIYIALQIFVILPRVPAAIRELRNKGDSCDAE